jgi:hypothetical protein
LAVDSGSVLIQVEAAIAALTSPKFWILARVWPEISDCPILPSNLQRAPRMATQVTGMVFSLARIPATSVGSSDHFYRLAIIPPIITLVASESGHL